MVTSLRARLKKFLHTLLFLTLLSGVSRCTPLALELGQDYCKNRSNEPAFQVTDEFCQMGFKEIQFENDEGKRISIKARLADDLAERRAGFQFIGSDVIKKTSILFLFPTDTAGAFHMCNVTTPLKIAWIRQDGSILEVQRMKPGPTHTPFGCPALYAPSSSDTYRYVFEAHPDFFDTLKLSACPAGETKVCKARLIIPSLR